MSDNSLTRRALLAAAGTTALTGSAIASDGDLTGGNMPLQQAYNVAGDLYIGPDSAKSNVQPDAGRVYVASDTDVEYYGDGSAWTKQGVGSSQESVPSVNTDELSIGSDGPATSFSDIGGGGGAAGVRYASEFSGSDGGAQIQTALDDLGTKPGAVVVGPNGPDDSSNVSGLSESNIWAANNPIEIPSNTILKLQNATIARVDDTDDSQDANILRNKQFDQASRDENIAVLGEGQATLFGNAGNMGRGSSEGPKPEYVGLRFYEVDELVIDGVVVKETEAWGIKPEDVTDLRCSNIRFEQQNGRNQDGIHLVGPVTHFAIKTIRGETEDDAIAFSNENDSVTVEGSDSDIGNIVNGTVHDISVKSFAGGKSDVKFVVGDHGIIANIAISNVVCRSSNGIHWADNVVGGSNGPNSCRNISITNLSLKGSDFTSSGKVVTGCRFQAPCRDVHISDVSVEGDSVEHLFLFNEAEQNRVTIEDVTGEVAPLDLVEIQDSATINDLTLKDITLDYYDAGFSRDRLGLDIFANATVNNLVVDGLKITGALTTAVKVANSSTGVLRDIDIGAASTKLNGTGSLRLAGDSTPVDVRNFSNVENSQGYHDGSGSNTAGPATNDGSGWTSLVDGTTIS